ncbi:MAG: hypothetical protein ABIZ52_02870 [Candidatus Limnocylindrales bacterium]
MTDEQTPAGEPTPSADPPPLAPLVEQAAAPAPPPPIMPPPIMPPPVAWGAAPVVAVAKGGRTTLAAIAGVLLILLGILGGLLGLMITVFGSTIVGQLDLDQFGGDFTGSGLNDPAAVVSGFLAFVGIVVVVYSLVYLLGGIGIVRSRGWGRVMGLIVGILSGLFWLLSLTGGGSSSGASSGIGFVLVMLGIHVYVVVVLLMFWRNKTA